jgi:hypothetical protein
MKEFLEYFKPIAPDFFSAVKGAPQAMIDKMVLRVGRQLPADYVEFLQTMGLSESSDNELILYRCGRNYVDFSLETLARDGTRSGGPKKAPPRYVMIGSEDGSIGDNVYFDFTSSETAPSVIKKGNTGNIQPWFDDFRTCLFLMGFTTLRLNEFRNKQVLTPNGAPGKALKKGIDDFARAHALSPVPVIGARFSAYNGSGVGVMVSPENQVWLGADKIIVFEELTAWLRGNNLLDSVQSDVFHFCY